MLSYIFLAGHKVIFFHDWILAPIYLVGIYLFAYKIRKKYTRLEPRARKFFIPALNARMVGAFASACMYHFYYEGGDSTGYFLAMHTIVNLVFKDPVLALQLFFEEPENYSYEVANYIREARGFYYMQASDTMMVSKVGAIFGLLCFESYLCIGWFFAFASFLGTWKIYEVFVEEYPHLYKPLAYACLFIPSVVFWGGAPLMKDTLVMFCMGYAFSGVYNLFIKKKMMVVSFFYMLFGFYLCIILKPYIILAMAAPMAFWIFSVYQKGIKSRFLRKLSKPVFIAVGIVGGFFAMQQVASVAGERLSSIPEIIKYAQEFQRYSISRTKEYEGTGYDLGDYEPTIQGILPMIPKSINVTLFRPYPWEVGKLINIPAVIESLATFFITLWVVVRVGIFRTLKIIYRDPYVMFCMVFALSFAFAVGFTTFNFGSLVRYKIPCLPFYFVGLTLIYNSYRTKKDYYRKTRAAYYQSLGQRQSGFTDSSS